MRHDIGPALVTEECESVPGVSCVAGELTLPGLGCPAALCTLFFGRRLGRAPGQLGLGDAGGGTELADGPGRCGPNRQPRSGIDVRGSGTGGAYRPDLLDLHIAHDDSLRGRGDVVGLAVLGHRRSAHRRSEQVILGVDLDFGHRGVVEAAEFQ